ncbi:MAG: SMI1/KNR4 family protein [Gemmataceae bacterium]|nr:SMI1/KNR4 family protein [Gemmataceae bacterium]
MEFEDRYSLRLPDDYRTFLMQVGNGGAGPYYGIYGLDELYETREDYWNDLSKPFPYRHKWEGPPNLLKAIMEAKVDEAGDQDRRGELIDEYWRQASRDGSINICEYGCNLRFLLIVNGPEFGSIWFDATPDVAGFSPVAIHRATRVGRHAKWCITDKDTTEENRVGFAEWYHCWLDWACRLVRGNTA